MRLFCVLFSRLCEIIYRTSEKNKNSNITPISSSALMVAKRLWREASFAHRFFRLRFTESSNVRKNTIIMMSPILFCIALQR